MVGAEDARAALDDGQEVTVSCAEGDEGWSTPGSPSSRSDEIALDEVPKTGTKIMVNFANPSAAYRWWRLPTDGVGLARMEFIIGNMIKIHPMALVRFDKLEDREAKEKIDALTRGYDDKTEYSVETLARGVARIAAAHHPNPVIVRMSDFKTKRVRRADRRRRVRAGRGEPDARLAGSQPLLRRGLPRGLRARVSGDPPGARGEADRVLGVLAQEGLVRGKDGLEVYVMAEIPANVILAEQFAERFDGFSIGSNDLTQLVLGVDRDSEKLRALFDERDPAVTAAIAELLAKARRAGAKTGICGQAPSDHPELAGFLVQHGIDSISITPDSFLAVKRHVAAAERERARGWGGRAGEQSAGDGERTGGARSL